ncbi:hypothetical protein ILUMI_12818 [Ignelater luminosus]|uniref:MYND-type domain-containing protein n=1 Tax=Ignelater luminosus TaxID=2038154 RepID=A0A8K0G6F1_IGNLU|nr:hypothetical protein ILUMI_12818 [Ignelater luminosus]
MGSQFVDKDYLVRCSQKTLQTNEKGFFLQFANHVAEVAGKNWIKNVFGKLKTDRERIRIIFEYKPVKDAICETLLHVQEIYRKKSAEVSQKRRLQAEELLQKKEYAKALILGSQSILRAPPTGENPKIDDGFTLALSFWTRSKILMELKKYSWALQDVQAATKEGLPDNLKAEVFSRMAVCYKGMGEHNRAKISFALAERMLEGNTTELNKMQEYKATEYKEEKEIDRRVLPNVSGSPHKEFSSATEKISLKEEKGMGRYVVAKEEINTGDTIVVEPPYAACLLPDSFSTHCHHCFERLVAPVGCPDCSNIAFCKAECRDIAVSTYHKYECHFLDLLIGSGMSILCHTALRMITQNPLKKCLEACNNQSEEEIFKLCANSNLRPPEDFFQRSIMAIFLLRSLQKGGYFEDSEANENVVPNEEELCIGELLLFYLQMLQFNAHEIYETRHETTHRFRTAKNGYIAVGVYPTVALFNHDCYPAVTR